jgi:hypothetical protein
MKQIEPGSWFKGSHNGHPPLAEPWLESPEHRPTRSCLLLACESLAEVTQLASIIGTLFPERACACAMLAEQVVHFNNHPATTRDEVDKILHAYELDR